MKKTTHRHEFTLAFDVGHSSIGWAVITTVEKKSPDIQGAGTLLFPANDCLASNRRSHRQQRRHIKATRLRIQRLREVLCSMDVLTPEELTQPGCADPWKKAAAVLLGKQLLNWHQLYDVLRWYAHNRGYDGNRRWARESAEEDEDTEMQLLARSMMDRFSTRSMAATVCALLEVDPTSSKKSSSHRPYKTLNMAFPRSVVEKDVREILEKHKGHLPGLDAQVIRGLAGDGMDDHAWTAVEGHLKTKPFKRFRGSIIFGQNLPRFDNRIISRCPFMFARIAKQAQEEGLDEEQARAQAWKLSKVPSRSCREFYRYRWALLLANIRVARENEDQFRALTQGVWLEGAMFEGIFCR